MAKHKILGQPLLFEHYQLLENKISNKNTRMAVPAHSGTIASMQVTGKEN
ncbi:MAG: hypothetical protein HRT52_21935 [Colwellia sp.]|nr:hypothetical protein [Colwellia sp.]